MQHEDDGYGYSYGYSYGSGDGSGYGNGDGSGSGSGYGYGDGDIKAIGANRVYVVDGVQTLIDRIKGNLAKGRILQPDLTTRPCWIARSGDYWAHGETAEDAMSDARAKEAENLPVEDRIEQFLAEFDRETSHPAKALFDAHGTLTGSCRMGREQFCRDRSINLETATYTVAEFCAMTRDQYGSDVIRAIEEKLL